MTVTPPKAYPKTPDYVSFEKGKESTSGASAGTSIRWTTFALYADPAEYEKIRAEWNYLLSETSPMIMVK